MKQVKIDGDTAVLLKMLRGIGREINTNASVYDTIDEAKRRYYLYRQQPDEDNEYHTRTYKNNVEVVEHEGWELFNYPVLIKHEKKKDIDGGVSAKTDEEYQSIVKEKSMGTALIKRADYGRYKELITDIRDQHGYGIDVYPRRWLWLMTCWKITQEAENCTPRRRPQPVEADSRMERRILKE